MRRFRTPVASWALSLAGCQPLKCCVPMGCFAVVSLPRVRQPRRHLPSPWSAAYRVPPPRTHLRCWTKSPWSLERAGRFGRLEGWGFAPNASPRGRGSHKYRGSYKYRGIAARARRWCLPSFAALGPVGKSSFAGAAKGRKGIAAHGTKLAHLASPVDF